jgi:lambda repressor-like predicted transcriptional regulator
MCSMNLLDSKKREQIVAALVEGNSIRATSRMFGVSQNTLGQGESFLIPDPKATTRRVVHATAVRLGVPVSIRKVEDGLRVYRLTNWPRREKRVETVQVDRVDEDQDWGA